jgi:hypothetical protein
MRTSDKTTLTSVPFQANISDIELTIEISLRPRVEIAFELLDFITVEGGAFLDLPSANVTITQLATSSVGPDCSSDSVSTNDKFDKAFQNLTHIVPDVSFEAGLDFHAIAEIGLGPADPKYDTSMSLASTTIVLPTECLAFQTGQPSGSAFAPAASVKAKVNSAASSTTPFALLVLTLGAGILL